MTLSPLHLVVNWPVFTIYNSFYITIIQVIFMRNLSLHKWCWGSIHCLCLLRIKVFTINHIQSGIKW